MLEPDCRIGACELGREEAGDERTVDEKEDADEDRDELV
jgi:hypothetical protein